jgi:general stress protein YciG/hemerythrin superfamily protein
MSGQQKRGFAALNPEKQRAIARKGGQAAHGKGTAHEFSPEEARRAGHLGGKAVSMDRAHMAAIGRKGGLHSVQRASAVRASTQSSNGQRPIDMSSARSGAAPKTVVELLRADHRRINTLFHHYEFDEHTHETRTAVLQHIYQELLRHTALEEEMVYPIVRHALTESEQQLVCDSVQAHGRIKELLQQLDGRSSEEEDVRELIQELQTCVRQHVQEEEQEILPKVEERAEAALRQLDQTLSLAAKGNEQRMAESPENSLSARHEQAPAEYVVPETGPAEPLPLETEHLLPVEPKSQES